ncbi:hypothetical protein UR09_03290 [Candidatus Nitromaritima sp. SCGC AAA799-A02]|nr:hypothetical protein UR09_03290 [Candidatus Nitromaritima sp. SCGC AAA799-A02]
MNLESSVFSNKGVWKVCIPMMVLSFLAACDSKPPDETAGNDKPELRIGRLICGGHLPLAIVEKKLQHELKTFRLQTVQKHDWNDVVTDLKSGRLAGTFILSPLAMKLIEKGLPARIVLKADRNGNGFVLSDKIKSISSLKEKKALIAVPHIFSQHNILLHLALKQNKVPAEGVKVLGMPPRDMINSLRRGEIDGFVVGEPEGHKSISLKVGWMASISPKIWENHMDHVFLATDKFIQEQPEQLQELIGALVRAGKYIEAHPHEAAIMGEDYTGSGARVFEEVLTTPPNWIDYSDMVPTAKDIEAIAANLVDMGLWKNLPEDMEKFFDSRFVISATQTTYDL